MIDKTNCTKIYQVTEALDPVYSHTKLVSVGVIGDRYIFVELAVACVEPMHKVGEL